MKKMASILVALVLVAVASVSAFAAGINSSEQAVIDALNGTITMKNGEMKIPAEFINSMENYFNTIEMTEEESASIIKIVNEGKTFVANTGAANIADMTVGQKSELLNYGKEAVAVLGMTMSYDKTSKTLYIYAPDGKTVFSGVPTFVATNGSSNNSSDVIKTTGADVNVAGIATIAGIAVLLVAAGAVYFVKTKKEA